MAKILDFIKAKRERDNSSLESERTNNAFFSAYMNKVFTDDDLQIEQEFEFTQSTTEGVI